MSISSVINLLGENRKCRVVLLSEIVQSVALAAFCLNSSESPQGNHTDKDGLVTW